MTEFQSCYLIGVLFFLCATQLKESNGAFLSLTFVSLMWFTFGLILLILERFK